MILVQPSAFLRRTLQAQAVGNSVAGSAVVLASRDLAQLLALPAGVLAAAGAYLLALAALCIWLAGRPSLARAGIWALAGFNALFAFESIALLALGLLAPNPTGTLVVCAEAWIALAFGELLQVGLRRSAPLRMTLGHRLQGQ